MREEMKVILGFTGTRNGMTEPQKEVVARVVYQIVHHTWADEIEFHHGDCIGADADFHVIVRHEDPTAKIVGHPPANPALRAWRNCDELRVPTDYLRRNCNIVRESVEMVATPREMTEQSKGGTWFTIHEAKRQGKRCLIVWPDGRTEQR